MLAKRVVNVFMNPSCGPRRRAWLASAMLLLVAAGSAAAQQFRSDTPDDKVRRYSASTKQWLSNPAAYTADKAHFDEYFNNYYFPDMTRTDDQSLGRVGEKRVDLFRKYLWATNNAQLQQDLTAMIYKRMKAYVTSKDPETNATVNPPYHPAVRYNAVLAIGMLDQQYSGGGSGAAKPKPLPEATTFLTQIVNYGAEDKPVPPPIVLGAVIGLERHMQLRESLPPEAVSAMTAALLKLVAHEQPIQEMDADAYAWIRVRAAEALARLGVPGEKNNVHNALVKLIATSKSLDDRCEVAGLIDKLEYKDVKLEDAATADALFALARDVATAEDKRAQDFQNLASGGAMPIGAGMGRGRGEFMPGGTVTEPVETFPRRQVLARLTNLRAAINKVKPSLSADAQKKADEVLKAIDPAKAAVTDKGSTELKMAAAVRTMAAGVNKAVPAPAADKAPAAKATAAS